MKRPPAIIVDNLGNVHALLHEQESLFYKSKIDQAWTAKQPLYIPGMIRAAEVFAVRLAITGPGARGRALDARHLARDLNQLPLETIQEHGVLVDQDGRLAALTLHLDLVAEKQGYKRRLPYAALM